MAATILENTQHPSNKYTTSIYSTSLKRKDSITHHFLFPHFGLLISLSYIYLYLLVQLRNKKTNTFQSFNKIRFNALTSHTYHHATKRSPTWQPPNLELQATLDNNFIGLETSLEVELLLINKYSLSSTFSLCNNFLK